MNLISREALRNYIVEAINKQEGLSIDYVKVGEVLAVIDMQPTIEAVPVVHGEMISAGRISARCSVCNYLTLEVEANFCPNCGADMRKKV